MSWITLDFKCKECEHIVIGHLMRRSERKDEITCTECSATMTVKFNLNLTAVSFIDGTKRFEHVKEKRKLDKLKRAARLGRNTDEVGRLDREIKERVMAHKSDSKQETRVKISEKE